MRSFSIFVDTTSPTALVPFDMVAKLAVVSAQTTSETPLILTTGSSEGDAANPILKMNATSTDKDFYFSVPSLDYPLKRGQIVTLIAGTNSSVLLRCEGK